jgi:hypothetical protein
MAVNLSALAGAGQQFFSDTGVVLSGGNLYSYAAGTTTPQATYTTAAGNIAHSNPIVLDSSGRVPGGEIWLTAGSNYKFVLTTSTNVTLATWDNITGINGTGITSNASNVVYDPAGTGAVATTVQAKLRQTVSVQDFGAVGNGVANDTAAINLALAASTYVVIPKGTYAVNATLTIPANTTVLIQGTIQPFANPGSAISFFTITGSNVNVIFEGGKINGLSNAYSNFQTGIYASGGATTRLSNINVSNGNFQNIGIDNGGTAISYDGITNGKISGNLIENCGQVSNLTFAGSGIYMQYCTSILVDGNTLNKVGSSGITNSGGVNCIITNNNLTTITLFGFKGGYIPSVATTNSSVSPTVNSFSVAYSAAALRNLQVGQAVLVMNAAFPSALGYIGAITNNTTYLTIFLNAPMNVAPDSGVSVQILETGTVYSDNTVHFTGDNGWDINGWANITVVGNSLYGPGVYQGAGIFGGLAAGFWFGYDPQGGYNKFITQDLLISGNSITNSYGTSISVQATSNNVNISNNLITNPNRSSNANSGGIDCNQYTFYRSNNQIISGNIITNGLNFGIYNNFASNVTISNNQIYSFLGVQVNAQQGCIVEDNNINTTATISTAYGVLVATTGVANSGVVIANNIINVVDGYGIRNTDAGYSLNAAFNGNLIYGSGTYTAFSNNGADDATATSVNGANQVERHVTQFATGQTITFAIIVASTANVFLLSVQSEASANVGLIGLYLISRSGTGTQITILSACADVTVALNASKQITVTNSAGANRTISAAISVLQ